MTAPGLGVINAVWGQMSCSVGWPGEEIPLFVSAAVTSGLSFLKMASCCRIISYYTVVEMLD